MKELQADLDKMTIPALRDLNDRIHATIETKEANEKAALIAKMHDMAAKAGLKLADVLGKGKKVKAAIQYRNPKDHTQTWTGRGRRPNWMAGKDPDAFRI